VCAIWNYQIITIDIGLSGNGWNGVYSNYNHLMATMRMNPWIWGYYGYTIFKQTQLENKPLMNILLVHYLIQIYLLRCHGWKHPNIEGPARLAVATLIWLWLWAMGQVMIRRMWEWCFNQQTLCFNQQKCRFNGDLPKCRMLNDGWSTPSSHSA
jgi:hypothetical protein